MSTHRRIVPAAALAASVALALLLSACTGTSSASPSATATTPAAGATATAVAVPTDSSGCPEVSPGDATSKVTVSGAANAEPTVKIASPLTASGAQVAVVTKGGGEKAAKGSTAVVAFAFYDGTTGKRIAAEGYTSGTTFSLQVGAGEAIPALDDIFDCQAVGSRLIYTSSATNAFGTGTDVTQYGIAATDSVVFVGDVLAVTPNLPATARANGTPVKPVAGFPTVTFDSKGQPTVKVPKGLKPPTVTKIEQLRKGTGPVVKSGDYVSMQYQGLVWKTGAVFDQSWGRGVAALATNQVVAGFGKALVGQKVGSQVLVTIPPKDGYGSQPPQGSPITATDTLIFVIDILADTPVK